MPLRTVEIPDISQEYVRVHVDALLGGSVEDPTTDAVEFAFMPVGAEPANADWNLGDWESSSITGYYVARILVGASGIALLDAIYDVWIRIFDGVEIVARHVGRLRVT